MRFKEAPRAGRQDWDELNALNQPIQMTSFFCEGTGNWIWFGYDPLGRCVKRWESASGDPATAAGATYYYYEGSNLIQEGPHATAVARTYVHGARADEWSPMGGDDIDGKPGGRVSGRRASQIVASTGAQGWLNHHYDARGHCIMLTDGSGGIQEQYEYDAFGQPYIYNAGGALVPRDQGSPLGNRFLFTGREWLRELRVYDYRHRMYQPEMGRFIQPDPKQFEAGDYNLYRYCHNDPVNKSDPTGLYGRGKDFADDKLWRKFNEAQKVAANNIERRLANMDSKSFERVFGKGSATSENMGRIRETLKGMLTALRDDGSNGYVANIARMDLNSGALAKGVPGGQEIFIHGENPFVNMQSRLVQAVDHEAAHNVGISGHGTLNGISAYRYGETPQMSAYRNLPSAERLRNPDHIMEYTE